MNITFQNNWCINGWTVILFVGGSVLLNMLVIKHKPAWVYALPLLYLQTSNSIAGSMDFCLTSCWNSTFRKYICFTLVVCRHQCECKPGYFGSGETGDCTDTCEGRCQNEVSLFVPYRMCVWIFFLFGVCQFVGFLCLLHLFLCVFLIVVLLRLSVCCVCCIHLFVAQICKAWIIPQEIPFDILYFYRERVWRTNMELLTANVLEVSLERTVNQSRSLPTLLEVRVSLLIHRNLSPM